MQKLNARLGVENGSEPETAEERLERLKKHCEWQCETENQKEGTLNEYDGYNCKICKNKGYIFKPHFYLNAYDMVQSTCKCQRIRKTIRALNRSGLADVVHDFTFDKYIATDNWQKRVLERAKSYITHLTENEGGWFFFGGATGSGKTHICTAVAISLLKRGNELKYMLWRDDASKLKAKVNDPDYEKLIQVYKSVDVLYIDDLFKTGRGVGQEQQRPTQGDINLAFEILNSRYIQKKPTIISSESTLTELIEVDEAIAGRIKQRSGDYLINIAPDRSKNYRLK